ncbi:TTHA0068-like domain containing protein [Parasponia andersonii]|uniref:TTHA0068-like domain containing protein n=1 Tax=Parasponia andersonii TaxID=3476 RepID=A0A2P5BUH6_PARAD|nr:TTHA0068-like domain containing protein [Parasponia andersonii]
MASPASLKLLLSLSSLDCRFHRPHFLSPPYPKARSSPSQHTTLNLPTNSNSNSNSNSFRISYRFSVSEGEDEDDAENCSFDEAVELFNTREYYRCHDFLEALWNRAEEPSRTLIHGILQCAVGFHHLFNQNHRGAMMELGEGLCKLRKMNFKSGPFHQFEQEISAVLDFIYHTQIELAACGDDMCVAMDRSERSYQLLGGYAAGQHLYKLQTDSNDLTMHIVFCPHHRSYANGEPPRVKLPKLHATRVA